MRESLVNAAFAEFGYDSRYGKLGGPLGGLFGSSKPQHNAQKLSMSGNGLLDDDGDDFDAFLSSAPTSSTPALQVKAPAPVQQSNLFASSNPVSPVSYGRTSTPPVTTVHPSPPSGSRSTHTRTTSRSSTVAIMSQNNARNSRPSTPSLGNVPIAPLLPPPPGSRPVSLSVKSGQGMGSLMGSIDLLNDFAPPVAAPPPSSTLISPPPSKNQNDLGSLFDLGSPPSSSGVTFKPVVTGTPASSSTPIAASRWSVAKPAQTTTSQGGLSAQDLSFFEGL